MGLLFAIIEVPDRGSSDPVVLISLRRRRWCSWAPSPGGRRTTSTRCSTCTSSRTPASRRPRPPSRSRSSPSTARRSCSPSTSSSCCGYSPFKAGMLTAPVAIGIMVTAPQAPKLVERIGTKLVVVIGLLDRGDRPVPVLGRTGDVVVRRRRRRAAAVRRRHGPGHGPGDRIDHGLAAEGQGRRRLGRERHHPPGRRRARRRRHRQRVRRHLPPRDRRARRAAGRGAGRWCTTRSARRSRPSPTFDLPTDLAPRRPRRRQRRLLPRHAGRGVGRARGDRRRARRSSPTATCRRGPSGRCAPTPSSQTRPAWLASLDDGMLT